MKPYLFYIILFLALFSCKTEAEKFAEQQEQRIAIIDSTITSFQQKLLKSEIDSIVTKTQFNGNISIVKDSILLYQNNAGFENFQQKVKLDSSSVFPIASNSKQFTAVLILLQEEAGKLSVNDPVSKYLKEFQSPQFSKITIKHLLNHTSGLSDFGTGLLSMPGEAFHYSNKGFYYLGQIIEQVTGKSYDENVLALFQKAGMKQSSTPDHLKDQNFASAYSGTARQFSEVQNMPHRLADKSISVPAGGLLSTVNDLHRWNSELYAGRILKPESLKKFMEKSSDRKHPILGKMGYGFGIMINLGQPEAYFHTGYVQGAPSLIIYYPTTKTSVVILSNIADESKGKNAVFNPHKEIKRAVDHIEVAVESLKNDMEKPISRDGAAMN